MTPIVIAASSRAEPVGLSAKSRAARDGVTLDRHGHLPVWPQPRHERVRHRARGDLRRHRHRSVPASDRLRHRLHRRARGLPERQLSRHHELRLRRPRQSRLAVEPRHGRHAVHQRLRAGLESSYDVAWWHHEIAEARMCLPLRSLPIMEAREKQESIHRMIEESQGNTAREQYHPNVVRKYPDLFPSEWTEGSR